MKNLRVIRERQRLTQAKLAALAEMPTSSVCHIEAGERNPSWPTALRIAGALGCSLDELAGRIEPTHVVAERNRLAQRLGMIAKIAAAGASP